MNIFGLDVEQLDLDEARAALSECQIEQLPNVPPFLSRRECAAILRVSIKVINNLVSAGQLPIVKIPGDSPDTFNLFGTPTEPAYIECILRCDLINFLEKALLHNKPILG